MFDLSHHGHEVMTVNDAGFSGKENGELLKLADSRFDALLTVDKNLPKQQNLSGRRNFNHHHSLKLQSACRDPKASTGTAFYSCRSETGKLY